MKSVFPLSKESEDALKFLEENLNNIHFNDSGQTEEEKSKKLNDINKLIEEIKRINHGRPPEKEKKESSSQQKSSFSNVQPQKLAEKWLTLHMEEDLLVGHMVANLHLSYDLLPIKLKLCSLFLSVFPEKAVIKKKFLIYWWIGEGFITKTSTMTAEEAGEEAFGELIEKGLIQPYHKTLRSPVINGCTVNPWIRRMLISMAREAKFFDLDKEGKITGSYKKSRRVIKFRKSHSRENTPKGELLAIYNMIEKYLSINEEFLSKIEKLKVLQLGRWQSSPRYHIEIEDTKFLDKLGRQKQLKYLSLRGMSRITTLPSSIVECQNLEILDLRACHNLEKLPSDIGSLEKLTHFIVSECYLLEGLPKGLDKISSLQVLKGFVIDHWRKNPCELIYLSYLEKLRKLSINIGRVSVQESHKIQDSMKMERVTSNHGLASKETEKKPLKFANEETGKKTFLRQNAFTDTILANFIPEKHCKMRNLRVLKLSWQMSSMSINEVNTEKPFASIGLPMLEKLDLWCFPGKILPSWITPTKMGNLERLYIRGGKLETWGPNLIQIKWMKLKILRLNYLKKFRFEKPLNMKDEFPNLLYFERIKCNQLSDGNFDAVIEWRREDGWQTLEEKLNIQENVD